MDQTLFLPYRQIHLDFHTGPWINDVAASFAPRTSAVTLQQAHVSSLTVFGRPAAM